MGKVSLLDSAPRRLVVVLTSSAVLLLGTPVPLKLRLPANYSAFYLERRNFTKTSVILTAMRRVPISYVGKRH